MTIGTSITYNTSQTMLKELGFCKINPWEFKMCFSSLDSVAFTQPVHIRICPLSTSLFRFFFNKSLPHLMIGWCVFVSKQLFNVWVFLIIYFMDPFITSAHCIQALLWMLGKISSLCLRFPSINYTVFILWFATLFWLSPFLWGHCRIL